MHLKQLQKDNNTKRYDVLGRDRIITISSNQPMQRNKGLTHVKPTWKVTGIVGNRYALERLISLKLISWMNTIE